jgi:hypothetical protein
MIRSSHVAQQVAEDLVRQMQIAQTDVTEVVEEMKEAEAEAASRTLAAAFVTCRAALAAITLAGHEIAIAAHSGYWDDGAEERKEEEEEEEERKKAEAAAQEHERNEEQMGEAGGAE